MTDLDRPELDTSPHDEADEADLIALVLHGLPVHEINLQGTDFYQPRHELIWNAAGEVGSDMTAIRVHLGLNAEQASMLLDYWSRDWVMPAHAPMLAERIKANAARRRLRNTALALLQQTGSDRPVASILETASRSLDEVADTQTPVDAQTPATLLPTLFDQLETGTTRGLSLPWPDLDRHLQGLQGSRLYVVGARPGVGKSMLGQNIAEHFAMSHEKTVAYFSLEMAATEVMMRILAHQSGVYSSKLQGADKLTPHDWERLAETMPKLLDLPIHINDNPTLTTADVSTHCHQLAARHDLGLVVIDYLQLVTPRDRGMNREQQVAETTRQFKILAKQLDVPVLLLSQLRRPEPGQASKRPGLTDLRESGAIEQDADVVIILHQPDPDGERWRLTATVAKNRSGQQGWAQLLLAGPTAHIQSAAREVA